MGNDVTLSGIKVGAVTDVSLDNGDALVAFTINGKYMTDAASLEHNATSGGDEEQTEADAPQASEPAAA